MTDTVTVGFLHPGTYTACFARSLQDLYLYDLANNQRIFSHDSGEFAEQCGSGAIVSGRNLLASKMLDSSSADWLFMVDSDMGFEGDTVDRLIESADQDFRPVVGGLAFAHKTDGRKACNGIRYMCQPTIYDFAEVDDKVGVIPRFAYDRDAIVPCGATGGACLLIHRSVLQRIRDQYGDAWFNPITHASGTTFSEDLSFCIRVAGVGVQLHIDTSVKTTHDKGGVFLDEEVYDIQQSLKGGNS